MPDLGQFLKSVIIKTVEGPIRYTATDINDRNNGATRVFTTKGNRNIDFLIEGNQNLHGYIRAEVFRRPYNPFKHHSHRSYGYAIRYNIKT